MWITLEELSFCTFIAKPLIIVIHIIKVTFILFDTGIAII